MTCRHIRLDMWSKIVNGQRTWLAQCSCGKIRTTWHNEEWKAKVAFRQIQEDVVFNK